MCILQTLIVYMLVYILKPYNMNTMVFRTSVRYRVKFVAATILVVALVFGGCYFIGGVKYFSWLYLVPIAVVYFVLFESNVVTDNALILYFVFLRLWMLQHPIFL